MGLFLLLLMCSCCSFELCKDVQVVTRDGDGGADALNTSDGGGADSTHLSFSGSGCGLVSRGGSSSHGARVSSTDRRYSWGWGIQFGCFFFRSESSTRKSGGVG